MSTTGPTRECRAIAALVAARLDALDGVDEAAERVERCELAITACPGGPRTTKLLALFGGDAADRAILLTALAVQVDPLLISRYQDASGRPWTTEWLAAELFGLRGRPLLHRSSAVARWRLVRTTSDRPGEPPAIEIDPAVREWLHGGLGTEPELSGVIETIAPAAPLDDWPVEDVARRIGEISDRGGRTLLTVEGLPGAGRATFVACVADRLGQRCLAVTPAALGRPWGSTETLLVHRHAMVAGASIVWRGAPPLPSFVPAGLWPVAVQAVTVEPGDPAPEPGSLAPLSCVLPTMQRAERAAMLHKAVPSARGWPEETRDLLARRRALTPGAIARIARIAPTADEDVITAANDAGAAAMGDLATRMTGALTWDDLVLPPALESSLRDLAFEATIRPDTWSDPEVRRLFDREAGMVALFHGPSGTGKTMAAQVIARALGFDLYRVDCAAVVSKYIGETAKNLRAIFARARTIDAVLFFDEAEALFSRRTEIKDSHDRHANTDTAYLLQLIEGSDGMSILATNRLVDMDRAFLRRIRYTFEFQRPGPAERAEIWRRCAEALMPERADDLEGLWPSIGDVLDVTGAQIKTILLAAHFAAARQGEKVTVDHLVAAAQREYTKEGRTVSQREKDRIRIHA